MKQRTNRGVNSMSAPQLSAVDSVRRPFPHSCALYWCGCCSVIRASSSSSPSRRLCLFLASHPLLSFPSAAGGCSEGKENPHEQQQQQLQSQQRRTGRRGKGRRGNTARARMDAQGEVAKQTKSKHEMSQVSEAAAACGEGRDSQWTLFHADSIRNGGEVFIAT